MHSKVDGSSWNVSQTYGKLTDHPSDARKVDGSEWNVPRTYGKLMEGPVIARKVDGRTAAARTFLCPTDTNNVDES